MRFIRINFKKYSYSIILIIMILTILQNNSNLLCCPTEDSLTFSDFVCLCWPDESFAVDDGSIPNYLYYRQLPDAVVLNKGTYKELSSLMKSFKRSPSYTDIMTTPTELSITSKVAIIPSGGLSGLSNSQIFRDLLADYVSSGNVLICFTQQYGYEFSALPGGEVGGFGWYEDQGCHSYAMYIDTWNQMLAGQTKNIIDASVDGYFTAYPENATVILRRTKNNAPALIMYPYGQGYVIATTMYEDWAFAHQQSTPLGRALIRDIITWANDPKELPQIKPGENINLGFEAKNKMVNGLMSESVNEKIASKVKINVLDPERNIVSETIEPTSLVPGQAANFSLLFNSSTYPLINSSTSLGIWSVVIKRM